MDTDLPVRTEYGVTNDKELFTNHFDLIPNRQKYEQAGGIHSYILVEVAAPKNSDKSGRSKQAQDGATFQEFTKHKKRRLIELLMAQHQAEFDVPMASNYENEIITLGKIREQLVEGPITVTYAERDGNKPAKDYSVQLKYSARIPIRELFNYLRSNDPNTKLSVAVPQHDRALTALNIICTQKPNEQPHYATFSGAGSTKFFQVVGLPQTKIRPLGGGLVALAGYHLSVRLSTGRVLLNMNTCTSAFYAEIRASNLISEFQNHHHGRRDVYTSKLKSFLSRIKVTTNHIKSKAGDTTIRRYHRIYDICVRDQNHSKNAQECLFTKITRDNQGVEHSNEMSVYQYFRQSRYSSIFLGGSRRLTSSAHDITLRQDDLILNLGNGVRPVYVPASLCTVCPGQKYNGPLSSAQQSSMVTIACRRPYENAKLIREEGLEMLGFGNNDNVNSKMYWWSNLISS